MEWGKREESALTTKELSFEVPFTVSEDKAKVLFAVTLYGAGKVSLGQAARLPASLNATSWMSLANARFPSSTVTVPGIFREIDREQPVVADSTCGTPCPDGPMIHD